MDNLKIGEIISKKRKDAGLTQNQLAKSLNVSFQAVSKWENGTTYPDISLLPKLAEVLNTTVDSLLGYNSMTRDTIQKDITGDLCQIVSVMIL